VPGCRQQGRSAGGSRRLAEMQDGRHGASREEEPPWRARWAGAVLEPRDTRTLGALCTSVKHLGSRVRKTKKIKEGPIF
jgi:hypothetical protein